MRYPGKPMYGGPPGCGLRRRLAGAGWVHEVKLDGVRCIARGGARPSLTSRTGRPLLGSPELYAALGHLPTLDGELVEGTLWVWDLPDLVGPLAHRRAALALLHLPGPVQRAPTLDDGRRWADYAHAEGVVLKHPDSPYPWVSRPGRTTHSWVKFK